MPPVQTTYSETMPKALPGMPANASYKADSCIVETVAGIGFGVAVSQGSADKGIVLGGASAAVFRGVTIKDITQVNTVSNQDLYERYRTAGVMFEGDIWVTVGGDVVKGGDATFNSTTGVLSSAAASGSQFAIAGARWMTTASSGGLAILRLKGIPAA